MTTSRRTSHTPGSTDSGKPQCYGSGSPWIRIQFTSWIRIQEGKIGKRKKNEWQLLVIVFYRSSVNNHYLKSPHQLLIVIFWQRFDRLLHSSLLRAKFCQLGFGFSLDFNTGKWKPT